MKQEWKHGAHGLKKQCPVCLKNFRTNTEAQKKCRRCIRKEQAAARALTQRLDRAERVGTPGRYYLVMTSYFGRNEFGCFTDARRHYQMSIPQERSIPHDRARKQRHIERGHG